MNFVVRRLHGFQHSSRVALSVCEGFTSLPAAVITDMPQGTMLGPLLF